MLALRIAFTAAAMALVVWLLVAGLPFGALAVVILGVWLRRAANDGRLARFANRFVKAP